MATKEITNEDLASLPALQLQIKWEDIDQTKLYQGKKNKYLNVTAIATPGNKYNQFMIVQSISAEERQRGDRGAIIGNANFNKPHGSQQATAPKPAPAATAEPEDIDEDAPF